MATLDNEPKLTPVKDLYLCKTAWIWNLKEFTKFFVSVFFCCYQILGKNRKEQETTMTTCKNSKNDTEQTASNIRCITNPLSKDETTATTNNFDSIYENERIEEEEEENGRKK